MNRSEINQVIAEAKTLLEKFRWRLPEWAYWSAEEFDKHPELAAWLNAHQVGWDVTDFGSSDFNRRGLGLFCLRNGIQSEPNSLPYAEKLLFIRPGQETPFHTHKVKVEDIINRGGGDLIIEFCYADEDEKSIDIRCDGTLRRVLPHEPVCFKPGQSVTIRPGLYHRFYAKIGGDPVVGGEVSQVNDDSSDNFFLESLGRFSSIVEDEPAIHPLWNEIGARL